MTMTKKQHAIETADEPSTMNPQPSGPISNSRNGNKTSLFHKMKSVFSKRSESNLRETIEEFIEEEMDANEEVPSVSAHEKILLSNVLELRDTTVVDVMIPRADITAISQDTSQAELLQLLSEKQYSRLPVYTESMDDVIGTVHIKDLVARLAQGQKIQIKDMLRSVPIVSPTMPVLDLMLEMRQSQKHMAMVVDEYGGIDGLVTIGDVIESIIGEIDDEYDLDQPPELSTQDDGSLVVDARYEIDDFEDEYGEIFTDDDRSESETLGGLVFTLAGRIPARGEIIKHDNELSFEIMDATPRRINRIRIRNLENVLIQKSGD